MNIVTEKKCSKCGKVKPISEFYKNGYGRASWCKDCHKKWSKQQASSGYFIELGRKRGDKPRKKLTPIEHCAFRLFDNARKRADRAEKPFLITREWVEAAVHRFCETHYYVLGPKNPFQPSLDRIDGSKPYTPENTRVVWLIENYARNGFSDSEVVEFCKRKLGL